MALGAKTFNFGKFLSFYSNNMEGNPNPTDVAHDWWKNWGTFKLIASEYNKYAIVYIRNMFVY